MEFRCFFIFFRIIFDIISPVFAPSFKALFTSIPKEFDFSPIRIFCIISKNDPDLGTGAHELTLKHINSIIPLGKFFLVFVLFLLPRIFYIFPIFADTFNISFRPAVLWLSRWIMNPLEKNVL